MTFLGRSRFRDRLRSAGGEAFPLDGLPAPTFAYSLSRKLTSAFSGASLVQVRETATSTVLDVGMVANVTDNTAVGPFGGSAVDKFVSIIRNQGSAGSAGDAIGATAAQHQCYVGGTATLYTQGTSNRLSLKGVGTGGYAIGTHADTLFRPGSGGSQAQCSFVAVWTGRNFRDTVCLAGADNRLRILGSSTGAAEPVGSLLGDFPDAILQVGSAQIAASPVSVAAGYRNNANAEFRLSRNGVPLGTPQETGRSTNVLAASQAYTLLGAGAAGWNSTVGEQDMWCEFIYWNQAVPVATLNAFVTATTTFYGVS